jgi:hypothetical protein
MVLAGEIRYSERPSTVLRHGLEAGGSLDESQLDSAGRAVTQLDDNVSRTILLRRTRSAFEHRHKPCGALQKRQLYRACWPIALLADENLGNAL